MQSHIRSTILLLTVSISFVSTAKILVLCPIAPWSHKNVFVPIISALAERGHHVTVVSAWQTQVTVDNSSNYSKAKQNVRDIVTMQGFIPFPGTNMFELRKYGLLGLLSQNFNFVYEGCHTVYQNKEFMALKKETFDLILIDVLFNDCLHGFIHLLKAPFVGVSTAPPLNTYTLHLGNRLPPSFVPNTYLSFTDKMNFVQRLVNVLFDYITTLRLGRMDVEFERIYRQYLDTEGDSRRLPGINAIQANVSFMLSNSHFALTYPRPTTPEVVEIGGVHCRPGRGLPKDLEEFASGAKDGLILFSLGTIFRSNEMPEETLSVFLKVFSKLKQRVLWKWNDEAIPNLPANVKISKWVPQQDVLAHKNTRLFMTHGGLLSTQEAIYHGVPILGIPLFADQDLNIGKAEMAGIALSVEILEITEEELERKIRFVLNDPGVKEKIKVLSSLFRDHLETPLERAVYWLEYLIRHKGAPHLRSAARDLNFFQYHSLDVAVLILAILSVLLFLLKITLVFLFRRLSSCVLRSDKSGKSKSTKSKVQKGTETKKKNK